MRVWKLRFHKLAGGTRRETSYDDLMTKLSTTGVSNGPVFWKITAVEPDVDGTALLVCKVWIHRRMFSLVCIL